MGYDLRAIHSALTDEPMRSSCGYEDPRHRRIDTTNAEVLTSYVTTNTVTFPAGDWVRVAGMTNVLQANASYTFSLARNSSGYWKLAALVSNPDTYPDGQAVVLPVLGGTAGVVNDPLGNFYDAAFVAGMTPSTSVNPTVTLSVTGSSLSLSWPADHLVWYAQSNSVSVATSSAWFDIPGSQSGTSLNITVDPRKNVYFRLRSP